MVFTFRNNHGRQIRSGVSHENMSHEFKIYLFIRQYFSMIKLSKVCDF
jgi:hypothetical protein